MKTAVWPFTIFLVALVIGFKSVQWSWDGVSYFNADNLSRDRNPASLDPVFDFSNLEGEALQFASKNRLLDGALLVRQENDLGFRLGHFVVKSKTGESLLACQGYDKVILKLQEEGLSVSGERTTLEVRGNCMITSDVNHIDPIIIPFSKLMAEPLKHIDDTYFGQTPVHVRVVKKGDEWPTNWVLHSVSLYNSDSKEELEVSIKDIPRERARDFHFTVNAPAPAEKAPASVEHKAL